FPLHHRPSLVIVFCQFGKYRFKVYLAIARTSIPTRSFQPTLVTAKCTLFARGIKLSIFYMKSSYALVVKIDIPDIVEALQHKMRGVVQNAGTGMVVHFFQEHL